MTIIFLIIGFAILYCYFVYVAPALSKRRLKKLQIEMMESQQRIDTLLKKQDRILEKTAIAETVDTSPQKPNDTNHNYIASRFDHYDPELALKVDARLIILNLDNEGEDRLIHVTDYAPISCLFRGHFVGGPQDGQVIEVNLDYNKEAINPETGERIPGIKRFLRQHRLKP
ncbi:hypothetical protein ACMGF7_24500 [Serratia sp. BNK-17]|uniref:hypothetical protein n=1 Tax=Serratia sp. BNK-17 TaxID=3376154 RepID=UPI003B42C987